MSVQTNEAIRSLRRRISGELEELRPATVGRNGRTETEGTDRFGHQHFLKAQWDHLLHGAEDMNARKGEEGGISRATKVEKIAKLCYEQIFRSVLPGETFIRSSQDSIRL